MSTYKVRVEDIVGAVGDDTFITDALNDTLNDVISFTPPHKSLYMSTTTYGGYGSVVTVDDLTPNVVGASWEDNKKYYSVSQTSTNGTGTGMRVNIVTNADTHNVTFTIVEGGTGYVIDEQITFTDPGSTTNTAVLIVATLQEDTTIDIETSRIINVIRNDSVNKRTCKVMSPEYIANMQNGNADKENIFYTSSVYPSYSYSDGKLDVFPIITSGESIEVHHIQKPSMSHGDSAINNIPDEVESMVITGTALRCLNRLMTDVADPMDYSAPQFIPPDYPTDVTDLDLTGLTSPSLNSSWGATTQAFDPSTNIPAYTAPAIGAVTNEELTGPLDADSAGYGTDTDFLDFSKWFSVVGELIEDEEDPELAQAQLGKIQTYIQAYSTQVQSNLNDFNATVQRYQADMQDAFKDGELLGETNRQYLQRYQQDIQAYQGDINALISTWDKNEMPKIQKWITQYQNQVTEYQADIQNAQIEAQADLQAKTAKYGWYQQQYALLEKLFTTQISAWAGAQGQDRGRGEARAGG